MTKMIDDPKFLACWHNVEESLKCLDANQVERLFSKTHASLSDFYQALSDEMKIKIESLGATISTLEATTDSIRKETSKLKSETLRLRDERLLMEADLKVAEQMKAALRNPQKTSTLDKKK